MENMPLRKQHIRDATWRRVDIRMLTVGTRIEEKMGKQGKETQRCQANETQHATGELEDPIIQNDLEYADGAQLLIQKDTHMSNYVDEWKTTT